jgi:hypothetical protein
MATPMRGIHLVPARLLLSDEGLVRCTGSCCVPNSFGPARAELVWSSVDLVVVDLVVVDLVVVDLVVVDLVVVDLVVVDLVVVDLVVVGLVVVGPPDRAYFE